MNSQQSLGEILKELRDAQHLPLREVADAIGIDVSLLGRIEKGQRKPSRQLISKFSKFFKVNKSKLLVAFLSDRVVYEMAEDLNLSRDVLRVAERKVKYLTLKDREE